MNASERGFTLIEVLISAVLMAFALLAMSGMFVNGYANIGVAGRSTNALAAGRLVLEDARTLDIDNLVNLDGFDSDDPSTLPADGPEREVARRWRYGLGGEGVGWEFTTDEIARWPPPSDDVASLGATGRIEVDSLGPTLARLTVTVAVPGTRRNVELLTLVSDP